MKLWRLLIISVSVVAVSLKKKHQGWFNSDEGEDQTASNELDII